ncbi:MAG: SAM-dependent methyltransferase [Clostridia bacterium]|nr:SAM-dependent methyltransferase [Clostridia bacterium]
MFITKDFTDFAVLDTGDGMKLEQWGKYILARPDPQVIWPKQRPDLWERAAAVYHRSKEGGGQWEFREKLPERWIIRYHGLSFYVKPTGFKHTGLFPEQAVNWNFMMERIRACSFQPNILNLFGYTGGATVACAAAGARVTHIDAAKSINGWARENLELSGLGDAPVRILADDCMRFVEREKRRGVQYDGIVMDPPSYGRSTGGVFRSNDNLYELVRRAAALLSDRAIFFLVNSYTTNLSSVVTSNICRIVLPPKNSRIEHGDLALTIRGQQVLLPCGTTTRWYALHVQ